MRNAECGMRNESVAQLTSAECGVWNQVTDNGQLAMNDLKFAFRQLLKNPGFTVVAVLTLALGIGANTAIFGQVNELLLRPLPVKEPRKLMALVLIDSQGDYSNQNKRHQLPR